MKRFGNAFKTGVAGLVLTLIAAACSSGGGSAPAAGTNGTNSAAQSGKKVTLQLMYPKNSGSADPRAQWMQENVELFKKENPNIDFEVIDNTSGDNYLTTVTTRMAANDVPDIFQTWTLERLRPFAESSRVYDLTEFLNSTPELKSKFSPSALSATTFNGKTYAMPLTQDLEVVYYNKDVFQKFNLQPPQTYDELLSIIDVLKKNDIVPISMPNKEPWVGTILFMMLAERIGGTDVYQKTVIEKTGSWTDKPFVEAATMMQDLVKRGAFEKNVNSLTRPESEIKLAQGKAGMYIGLTSASNVNLVQSMGDKVGFFNFPDVAGGKGSKDDYLQTPTNAFSVGAATKHPEEVKKFIKFMYSQDRQLALAKLGSMLAYQFTANPGDLPPLSEQLAKTGINAKNSMYFWDIPLGVYMGKELNNTTQGFYMDVEPQQALSALQKKAEDQKKQAQAGAK
ncbi:extracellular solute-binding protein [Paenibacillus filicis]|uniref:Extracellular solute-binding protein n=1 Tax=Paenibacillus gyeongsangnamensis TaxID=3388067 RepID=A0ABT4Q8I9_9BACL|nr:extracellular solute-binding protein [Paenibacillus filicis]MCZ8513191.1 extracellular solute-binding protein [Paenibacillus filicis]